LTGDASKELASPAMIAMPAVASVPAYSYSLARLQVWYAGPDCIDDACHFVAWDTRIFNPRPGSFLNERIAVANATSLDFDAHPSRAWIGDGPLDDFQRGVRAGDLGHAHGRHDCSLGYSGQCLRRKREWREKVSPLFTLRSPPFFFSIY
jgi:hypothetical protein